MRYGHGSSASGGACAAPPPPPLVFFLAWVVLYPPVMGLGVAMFLESALSHDAISQLVRALTILYGGALAWRESSVVAVLCPPLGSLGALCAHFALSLVIEAPLVAYLNWTWLHVVVGLTLYSFCKELHAHLLCVE